MAKASALPITTGIDAIALANAMFGQGLVGAGDILIDKIITRTKSDLCHDNTNDANTTEIDGNRHADAEGAGRAGQDQLDCPPETTAHAAAVRLAEAQSRRSSLMLVFDRVCASTFFTITAQ